MRPTRFLWLLMVVLLVPALALSGCDKKKHVNRDDDDDGSSSGSKEKSEQVEKREDKKLDDITGRYEMDEESVKEMTQKIDGLNNPEFGFTFNFKKNGTFEWTFIYSGSLYLSEIKTNLNFSTEMFSDGDWTYDKKQRILSLVVNNVGVSDQELTFDDNTPELQAEIEKEGGYEAMKEAFFNEFDPNDIFQDTKFKITELNADGFYARNIDKNVKVKFNRVD